MRDRLKSTLFKAAKPFVRVAYRQMRGMTLGTRSIVFRDSTREVLLVRHGYAPGWLLPGGGVERGETLVAAALRELHEEAGIVAEEDPVLLGIFLNDAQFRGDHVACFVVRQFREEGFTPTAEIAEARFFPVAELPDATTPGTRRRIAELLAGGPPSDIW